MQAAPKLARLSSPGAQHADDDASATRITGILPVPLAAHDWDSHDTSSSASMGASRSARAMRDPPAKTPTTAATTLPAKEFKTRDGKILPSIDALAKMTGDAKAGAAVFRNEKGANCVKCHQIGDDGNMIGPPLTVIGGKLTKPQLYEAILYPSAAIEMGYETWVAKTKDGDIFSGLKTEDTPDHITIKDTDGKYHDIDRDKLDRLVKQNISLMPEGLSEAMTQKDLLDLVEYLASLKPQ